MDKTDIDSSVTATALEALLMPHLSNGRVIALKRLSGGANMETWSFDYIGDDELLAPLILRREPGIENHDEQQDGAKLGVSALSLDTEAALVSAVADRGVAVPKVVCIVPEHSPLGPGYVMSRESGEALPNKLFSEPQYAKILPEIPFQAGVVLAGIHAVPVDSLPKLTPSLPLLTRLDDFQSLIDRFGNSSPVHQIAVDWLRKNQQPCPSLTLVHGDFRNGNLLIGPQGLSSVLDWELAHIGDPVEDLGYFCANVWRFGRYEKTAGGFGAAEDLLAGYLSVAGHAPSLSQLRYWQLFAALNWGLITLTMLEMYRSGQDATLERAAIGRRMSESEIDILLLLDDV